MNIALLYIYLPSIEYSTQARGLNITFFAETQCNLRKQNSHECPQHPSHPTHTAPLHADLTTTLEDTSIVSAVRRSTLPSPKIHKRGAAGITTI